MGFSENFPDELIMNSLGDDIVYMPKQGGAYPIKAVVDFDMAIDEYSSETRHEVEFLKSAVGWSVTRGDRIVYSGKTYTIDTRISDDVHYERWGMTDG